MKQKLMQSDSESEIGKELGNISKVEHSEQSLEKGNNIMGNVMIHSGAKVSEHAVIGPNVVIGDKCEIGDGCRISNSTILAQTKIKEHTFIRNSIIGWQCNMLLGEDRRSVCGGLGRTDQG